MKPLVTVVVCTYNDEGTIGTVLEAITGLSYEPREVIVINDASTDGTREIVDRFPVVAVHNSKNRGLGFNQNLGLQMARGEYLAMIQSDCEVLGSDWLDHMLEYLSGDVAAVVSQREIQDFAGLPAGARLFNAVAPQDLQNNEGRAVELQYCRGKADVYSTAVLKNLGGWNRAFFTAGEDTDLSIRLRQKGFRILLHPTVKVRYLFSARQISVTGALKKAFLYGKTAYPLYQLHRYDGIQSRTYLTVWLSILLLILPEPANAAAGILLAVFAATCRIQTTGGRSLRFVVLAFIASIPLLVLHFSIYRPDLAAVPLLALASAGAAYTIYLAAKNTARNHQKGEKAGQLPGTFLFCIGWRLISGLGYLAGACEALRKRRRVPLENHESLTDQSTEI